MIFRRVPGISGLAGDLGVKVLMVETLQACLLYTSGLEAVSRSAVFAARPDNARSVVVLDRSFGLLLSLIHI